MLEAIRSGHEAIQRLIELQERAASSRPASRSASSPPPQPDAELREGRRATSSRAALRRTPSTTPTRPSATTRIDAPSRPSCVAQLGGAVSRPRQGDRRGSSRTSSRQCVRTQILEKGMRPDGRGPTEIRPIWLRGRACCRAPTAPALFTRGQTQVLSVATLGSPGDEQRIDGLGADETKRYMHHYNFPPFSVGEARPLRGAGPPRDRPRRAGRAGAAAGDPRARTSSPTRSASSPRCSAPTARPRWARSAAAPWR